MTDHERQPTPLEIQIKEELKTQKEVRLQLNADEFRQVAQLLVAHLLKNEGAGDVTVYPPEVKISANEVDVMVVAEIKRPISATLTISYTLFNSRLDPGSLLSKNVSVKISNAGFLAKKALRLIGVEEKVKKVLGNLNEVLLKNPPPIIANNGFRVAGIDLTLEENLLRVQLTSS